MKVKSSSSVIFPEAGRVVTGAGSAAENNLSLATKAQTKLGRGLRTVGIVAALSILPFSTCQAMYKCKQANETYAYQDSPCAESIQTQSFNDATLKATNPTPNATNSNESVNQESGNTPQTPEQPSYIQNVANPSPITNQDNADESDNVAPALPEKNQTFQNLITATVGFLFIYLYFRWNISVARRAKNNNRSFITWLVISLHITPLFAGLLLILLDGSE